MYEFVKLIGEPSNGDNEHITSRTMRTQRPRGTITQGAVVSAALAVVDQARVEGLTIRAVARQVGSPPMSLYSHFENKDQLLDLMYAEIVRRLYPDHGHTSWQAELFALCQHIRSVLLDHPHWTELLARPTTPSVVPVRERILSLMVAEGMTPEAAKSAMSGAALSSTGFVLAELNLRTDQAPPRSEPREQRRAEWGAAHGEVPVGVNGSAHDGAIDIDGVFLFTLRALVHGLEARPASSAGS